MKNPALMHGSDWTGQNVAGYWISEKLDGWRAAWTGLEFITREGNTLSAADWFTVGMPGQALDGELCAGPGSTHDDVSGAVRSGDWTRLTFRPFDVAQPGITTEAAQAVLTALPLPAHVRPVEFRWVTSTEAAIAEMLRVVKAGGEGIMARKPGSRYAPGRNRRLLKFKPEIVQAMNGGRPCSMGL